MDGYRVPENFPNPQERILATDFLKESIPTHIKYDVQEFIKLHGIIIPCTKQDAVLIPTRSQSILY